MPALFDRLAPLLFVFIWSTGWIVPRYSYPDAEPLTFLVVRFAFAGLLMFAIAFASGAWETNWRAYAGHALVSGVLIHAIYLGGVWWAIAHGAPSTISALLSTVQPILTALLAPSLLGEALTPRKAGGVALGFIGLLVTLAPKLFGDSGLAAPLIPVLVNLVGMVGITLGAIYQKRFLGHGDLRAIATLQYLAAGAVMLPSAFLVEPMRFQPTLPVLGVLAWSVLALSIGAILLLLLLIRHGEASRAALLLYLVPPTAALQAAVLLDERLSLAQIVGFAVTILGVALARSG